MSTPVSFHKFKTADSKRGFAWLSAVVLFAGIAGSFTGCSGVSGIPVDPMAAQYGDRCYIENSQFAFADQLYDRMGSLQLVYKELCDTYQWRPCEVNEAMYRLRKVHDLP